MAALEHEFSLDGMLVFNGLYECRVPEDLDFETVLLSLPEFEEGTREDPGDGFTRLALDKALDSRGNIGNELKEELREVDHIRYVAEQYERTVAEVDGERRAVSVPSQRQADLHWRFPSFLAARGSREDTEQAVSTLQKELGEDVRFSKLEFDSHLLQQLFEGAEPMPGLLRLERITEVDLRSTSGKFGQFNRVSTEGESLDRTDIISRLSGDHEIESLGGVFGLEGHEIHATVSTNGRIHVRASGAIQHRDDYGRIFLALGFLNRFIETYRHWDSGE
jgi:hypothetical protein